MQHRDLGGRKSLFGLSSFHSWKSFPPHFKIWRAIPLEPYALPDDDDVRYTNVFRLDSDYSDHLIADELTHHHSWRGPFLIRILAITWIVNTSRLISSLVCISTSPIFLRRKNSERSLPSAFAFKRYIVRNASETNWLDKNFNRWIKISWDWACHISFHEYFPCKLQRHWCLRSAWSFTLAVYPSHRSKEQRDPFPR